MTLARYLLGAIVALGLTACLQDDAAGGAAADSPEAAVLSGVEALKDNDVKAFLKSSMHPDTFAKLETEFQEGREEAMAQADDDEYNAMMAKLTADDAAETLFAELQPQLQQVAPQLPFMVGMIRGMGGSAIAQQEDLSDVEKENARKALEAVGTWAEQADLASEENLKRAIEETVELARDLDLDTMDDVRALSFDQMLGKANIVLAGVKDIVGVYGLDVDAILGSVETKTLNQTEDAADLEVKFDFLGQEFTTKAPMVKTGQGWYAKGSLDDAG